MQIHIQTPSSRQGPQPSGWTMAILPFVSIWGQTHGQYVSQLVATGTEFSPQNEWSKSVMSDRPPKQVSLVVTVAFSIRDPSTFTSGLSWRSVLCPRPYQVGVYVPCGRKGNGGWVIRPGSSQGGSMARLVSQSNIEPLSLCCLWPGLEKLPAIRFQHCLLQLS